MCSPVEVIILLAKGITESSRVVRSEIVAAGYILSVSYATNQAVYYFV
jgi:hypothetical protein